MEYLLWTTVRLGEGRIKTVVNFLFIFTVITIAHGKKNLVITPAKLFS